MKEKKRVKKSKKALKKFLKSKSDVKGVREMLGMQDYGLKDVRRAFKQLIKRGFKIVQQEEEDNYWDRVFGDGGKNRDDDDDADSDPSSVIPTSRDKNTARLARELIG